MHSKWPTLRFDRRLLLNFDWVLLVAVLAVIGLGIANLYSAGYGGHAGTPVYLKQLSYTLVGLGFFVLLMGLDYRLLGKYAPVLYLAVVFALVLAAVMGKTVSGSQRWIDLGIFRLQPSEPAKLALVITLASYYFRKDTGKGFTLPELAAPMALTGLPFVLILLQPDLGTAMMLAILFGSITLFVKLTWPTFIVLASGAVSAAVVAWKYVLKPYQIQRILTFLDPEQDPSGAGYHILQSKIAVGSGLKFGKGWLQGTQGHLDFLPERHTDFAFSVWGEEWGFVGSLVFLGCYFFLILWGLNIALHAKDKFGVLLAFGIVTLLFWQAFINLAMVLGLLPVVGIPLPMVSYGGSSLLTTLMGLGILMSIRMRRFLIV
ncbi:MAG: rod shape-determining protein RodA [Thermodesulfobacteriota bacterium]